MACGAEVGHVPNNGHPLRLAPGEASKEPSREPREECVPVIQAGFKVPFDPYIIRSFFIEKKQE